MLLNCDRRCRLLIDRRIVKFRLRCETCMFLDSCAKIFEDEMELVFRFVN